MAADNRAGFQAPPPQAPRWWDLLVIATYLVVCFFVQIILLLAFWPKPAANNQPGWDRSYTIFGWVQGNLSDDARLIVLVLLAGGVGAMVHALRSFSVYVGSQRFIRSWGWWYIIRPFQGGVLALVFYFVLRGGLMAGVGSNDDTIATSAVIHPYGFAAISVLVGLFSEQAMAKLQQIAESFFTRSEPQDDTRSQRQQLPPPEIITLNPETLPLNATQRRITVVGKGFTPGMHVLVGETLRPTEFLSDTQLVVTLDQDDVQTAGTKQLSVVFDASKDVQSEPVDLIIEA